MYRKFIDTAISYINYIRNRFNKFKRTSAKTGMKVTEVSVMVSKKLSINFNSCCVSYSVKATLDENDRDYLKALDDLKDQLIIKVQEALNGKKNGNGKPTAEQEQARNGGDKTQTGASL